MKSLRAKSSSTCDPYGERYDGRWGSAANSAARAIERSAAGTSKNVCAAASARAVPLLQVCDDRTDDPLPIEPAVLIEPRILNGNRRLAEVLTDPIERDDGAPFLAVDVTQH